MLHHQIFYSKYEMYQFTNVTYKRNGDEETKVDRKKSDKRTDLQEGEIIVSQSYFGAKRVCRLYNLKEWKGLVLHDYDYMNPAKRGSLIDLDNALISSSYKEADNNSYNAINYDAPDDGLETMTYAQLVEYYESRLVSCTECETLKCRLGTFYKTHNYTVREIRKLDTKSHYEGIKGVRHIMVNTFYIGRFTDDYPNRLIINNENIDFNNKCFTQDFNNYFTHAIVLCAKNYEEIHNMAILRTLDEKLQKHEMEVEEVLQRITQNKKVNKKVFTEGYRSNYPRKERFVMKDRKEDLDYLWKRYVDRSS